MHYSFEHDSMLRQLRVSLGPQWSHIARSFNVAFSNIDDRVYTQAMLRNRYARMVSGEKHHNSCKKRCRNCGKFVRGHSCRSTYQFVLFKRGFCPLVDDGAPEDDGAPAEDDDGADSAPELPSDWEDGSLPANAPEWPYDAVECAQDFMTSMMDDYQHTMRYRAPQFGDLCDDRDE